MSDRVFLATKTNVGIDIDNKPPTAELSIARRELNIQPVFPDYTNEDSIMPTFAAFGLTDNWINPRIRAEFAGGEAAIEIAKSSDMNSNSKQITNNDPKISADNSDKTRLDVYNGSDSIACLDKKPNKTIWREIVDWFTNESDNSSKSFYFATDTAYGLKVMWSGTAGPYPDSLKLGYNRKEFASAPLFIEENTANIPKEEPDDNFVGENIRNEKCNESKFIARMPSFYASIDNSSGLDLFDKYVSGYTNHTQVFATGRAAYEYTKKESTKEKVNSLLGEYKKTAPSANKQED